MFGAFVYQAFRLELWSTIRFRNIPPRPVTIARSSISRLQAARAERGPRSIWQRSLRIFQR
jgi:hypothetical protein